MRKLPDESRLAQNLDTGQSDADSEFPEQDL
jgi:hypothetical protein